MDISDMILPNFDLWKKSRAYRNMIEGFKPSILKAPDSEKKFMLLNILDLGLKLSRELENRQNEVNNLLHLNTYLENSLKTAKNESDYRLYLLKLHEKKMNLGTETDRIKIEELEHELIQLKEELHDIKKRNKQSVS